MRTGADPLESEKTICSFPFSAKPDARILILGSIPGEESLLQHRYYAHPRNRFWHFMGEFFGAGFDIAYPERLEILNQSGIALWDVIARCNRKGSLDTAVSTRSVEVNDFAALFRYCPGIRTLFFNGKLAYELYRKRVLPLLPEPFCDIERIALPSTSPANASIPDRVKKREWRRIVSALERSA